MKNELPSRFRRARADASLRTVQKNAEELLGLPAGSLKFVYPSGRKAREDATVAALRRSWE